MKSIFLNIFSKILLILFISITTNASEKYFVFGVSDYLNNYSFEERNSISSADSNDSILIGSEGNKGRAFLEYEKHMSNKIYTWDIRRIKFGIDLLYKENLNSYLKIKTGIGLSYSDFLISSDLKTLSSTFFSAGPSIGISLRIDNFEIELGGKTEYNILNLPSSNFDNITPKYDWINKLYISLGYKYSND